MATDATGTPTALGIPKFNTSADAPSGLGGNAQMDSIDALLQANTGFQGSGIVIKGNKLVSTDANTAFSLFGNGTMKWGPGGVTALDTTLARTGVSILTLTGSLTVSGTLNAQTGIQINGVGIPSSVFGRTGVVVATSGDYAVGQVTGAAPLASPALTGSPTSTTQADADNSTNIATTAWVRTRISNSSVSSVFSRTGAVVANTGDYTAAQVTNAADKSSTSQQSFTRSVGGTYFNHYFGSAAAINFTLTPDLSVGSYWEGTGTSGSGTDIINAPTNVPASGSALLIIVGRNTGINTQSVSWNAVYKFQTQALPASLGPGGRFMVLFAYDPTDAVWREIGLF